MRSHTLKTKVKISEIIKKQYMEGRIPWNKGLTKETDSRIKKMANSISKATLGRIPWNKGLTKETDDRVRKYAQSLEGRFFSADTKHKLSEAMKKAIVEGKRRTDTTKGMKIWSIHRHPQLGKPLSGETKRKSSLSHINRWKDPIYRQKVTQALKGKVGRNKGVKLSPETLRIMSEKTKLLWKTPAYRQRVVEAVMKALHKRPNRKETALLNIIKRNYLPFEYVGDGKVIIDGYCPDFINNNGKKQVIELYGDYWHKNDDPQKRINHFKRFGFDTLIIWEHELTSEQDVLDKIKLLE